MTSAVVVGVEAIEAPVVVVDDVVVEAVVAVADIVEAVSDETVML